MNPREFRLAIAVTALAVLLVSLGALVTMHERHYSKRRLRLLEGRVDTIEAILTEDRRS